jgi:hypothetical protein
MAAYGPDEVLLALKSLPQLSIINRWEEFERAVECQLGEGVLRQFLVAAEVYPDLGGVMEGVSREPDSLLELVQRAISACPAQEEGYAGPDWADYVVCRGGDGGWLCAASPGLTFDWWPIEAGVSGESYATESGESYTAETEGSFTEETSPAAPDDPDDVDLLGKLESLEYAVGLFERISKATVEECEWAENCKLITFSEDPFEMKVEDATNTQVTVFTEDD